MALSDRDIDSMTDYLLASAGKVKRIEPPVDLFDLARIQRVTAVDLRPMLPTGGLSCRSSGFVIYVQDLARSEPSEVAVARPITDRPRMTTRQRFTMAHELGHTLLFQTSDPPQPRAGSPKGAKLEALCHRAARRILMPPKLVAAEIAKRPRLDTRNIRDLAQLFDVSVEVVLRRCDELTTVRDSDRAVLYVRKRSSGVEEIAGFYCSKWFQIRKGSSRNRHVACQVVIWVGRREFFGVTRKQSRRSRMRIGRLTSPAYHSRNANTSSNLKGGTAIVPLCGRIPESRMGVDRGRSGVDR